MSTVQTSHRNYVFPLKDEDLEASNAILNASFNMIDLDVHNLFTDKANTADTDLSTEVDTKISNAINALDIYGTYDGDVASDPGDNTKLYLKDIFSTPGSYTKVSVNAKGQVTFGEQLSKSDITDYNEQDYLLDTDIKDTVTDTVSLWSSDKIDTELSKYVLLTNYTDNDILTKIKNVDGGASGLDSDLLDGQEGAFYMSFSNTTDKPTTLAGYGITDAQDGGSAFDGVFSSLTSVPTTIVGYGITDDIVIDSSYVHTDSNYTTADQTKLGLIEDSATADQDGAEIKIAYELEADTNAYDDAAVAKLLSVNQSGDTASRPIGTIGEMYFDTDLGTSGKPIWFDGTSWVDATGTVA